jgi:hypothetical protein
MVLHYKRIDTKRLTAKRARGAFPPPRIQTAPMKLMHTTIRIHYDLRNTVHLLITN